MSLHEKLEILIVLNFTHPTAVLIPKAIEYWLMDQQGSTPPIISVSIAVKVTDTLTTLTLQEMMQPLKVGTVDLALSSRSSMVLKLELVEHGRSLIWGLNL